ncbi:MULTISPECIES: hypothetical protein [Thalassobaculum]|uniref:Uncharacterized protein n=1 Tax=Thalassobaculum litoreum DSM 18839 TaxID=1123362 RepID=A0A8G2BI65_9PROT|nr:MULTISPECIES: hypothetical protein [Thalassobaculum]SDF85236.1 hypothetical protein SAMN05660686_02546 [Thalassobaculum litoreum DSM 18839]
MAERPFLAGIGPIHAECESRRSEIQESLIRIDRDFHQAKLDLQACDDIDTFKDRLREVGKYVPSAFDSRFKPARTGDCIGLTVRDDAGIAATLGVRLYRFTVTSMADHLETLSLFYSNPAEQMIPGERLSIQGDADAYASRLQDKVYWTGGLWVRPDLRGRQTNFPKLLGIAAGSMAHARWGRVGMVSVTEKVMAERGLVSKSYDMQHVLDSIIWTHPARPEKKEWVLLAKDADYIARQTLTHSAGEVPLIYRVDENRRIA